MCVFLLKSNVSVAFLFQMRYVAAYLLASLGGKDSPNAADIKKILDSVGIEADDTRLDKVYLSQRNILTVKRVELVKPANDLPTCHTDSLYFLNVLSV